MKGQKELERFIEHLRADRRSIKTIGTYWAVLKRMLSKIGKEPENITFEDLERYKEQQLRKFKQSSLRLHIAVIRRFFRYLDMEDKIKKLTMPKKPKRIPEYLTQDEAYVLLEKAKRNHRNHAILTTFLYTGIRHGELINLDISDINFEENLVFIRSGKGDRDRQIPLHPQVKQVIRHYLKYRIDNGIMPKDGSDILFVGYKGGRMSTSAIINMTKEYTIQAGIRKNITPHKLRHTALSHLYRATGDIRLVQKVAGHSVVTTTEIYVHSNIDYLKEVYDKSGFGFTQRTIEIPKFQSENEAADKVKNKHRLDYFG